MQEIDNLSKFGNSFQSKVVSALLTDGKFLEKLSEILSPKFFESEANKWIVDEIIDYNEEFRKPPTMDVFKVKLSKTSSFFNIAFITIDVVYKHSLPFLHY